VKKLKLNPLTQDARNGSLSVRWHLHCLLQPLFVTRREDVANRPEPSETERLAVRNHRRLDVWGAHRGH
jgi:hypothetical protein